MQLNRVLFIWYFFLTLLPILAPITLSFSDLLPGLIITWLIFISFFCGSRTFTDSIKIYSSDMIQEVKSNLLVMISFFSVLLSIYAAYFYTGKTPVDVFRSLFLGESLYNQYQRYFLERSLNVFTLSKLPAILANSGIKFILLLVFIEVLILRRKMIKVVFFSIFLSSISFIYFSIARGTSFELFELLMIVIFCVSLRIFLHEELRKMVFSYFFKVFSLASLFLIAYNLNISARYSFEYIPYCSNFTCYQSNAFMSNLFPSLAVVMYKLTGYFTFGIYYLSNFITYLFYELPSSAISLLPIASIINLNSEFLCYKSVDCGVAWVPDAVALILYLGIPAFYFFIFWLGVIYNNLLSNILRSSSRVDCFILYFIFLFLVSLPIGSFLKSSSSILIIAGAFSIKLYKGFSCK